MIQLKLNHQTAKMAVGFALALSVVIFLSLLQLPARVRNQTRLLNSRLWLTHRLNQIYTPFTLIDHWYQARLNHQWLTRAYFQSQAQLVKLDQLEKENQTLRQFLTLKKYQPAKAIITTPVYSHSQAMIAAGQEEGVKTGSLVLSYQVLLGVVGQVWPHTARVRLLAKDQNLKLLAKTKSGVNGLVRLKNGKLQLTEIPANLVVKENEPVFTTGQAGIPPGLLVGLTEPISEKEANPTYSVKLNQGVSFYEVPVVKVLP